MPDSEQFRLLEKIIDMLAATVEKHSREIAECRVDRTDMRNQITVLLEERGRWKKTVGAIIFALAVEYISKLIDLIGWAQK